MKYLFTLCLLVYSPTIIFAEEENIVFTDEDLGLVTKKEAVIKYEEYKKKVIKLRKLNQIEGNSFIISGALSLLGGTVGGSVSKDQTEQLAYSAFQSIGVAAIGYGLYKKRIGTEREHVFRFIDESKYLSTLEKYALLKKYYESKKKREKQERLIKALTHGLVGVLNIYSSTQQDNDRLKTTLYFVGGVNLLASVSYAF